MKIKLSQFLQWRFNIFLYLTFGWGIAKIYIFLLGKLYFYFNQKEKRLIKDAVFDVIGRTDHETNVEYITEKVFKGILSHYYEKLFIAFEEPKEAARFLNDNILSNDLAVLRRSLSKGNGVIIVTGHYGAIEYIPTLLAVKNFNISMIAKFKTKQLKRKVFSQAIKYDIRLIDAENTGNVLKTAINELRENRILVTQCDEIKEWRLDQKGKISFLGQVTGVDRTINIIQKRTGAEIVFGIIHRYSLDQYKLVMYSYEEMLEMLNDVSSFSVGETILKFLEQFIYHYPEQWYQWKEYVNLKSTPVPDMKVEQLSSLPFLKPAFGKIA